MISIIVYILCLTCLVNLSNQKSHNNYLSTLLPSVFYWDTINYVYVTPTKSSKDDQSVDITLQIEGENIKGTKTLIFSETIRQKKGIQQIFNVYIPKFDSSNNLLKNFYISVSSNDATRSSDNSLITNVLAGTSNLNLINLQTDKAIYRPTERINIKALPLTNNGEIYKGPIHFHLLDPNGFRIFNKTNNRNVLIDNDESIELEDEDLNNSQDEEIIKQIPGFITEYFDLPKFLRYGDWKIIAFADEYEYSNNFQISVRIEEYEIPKFHVFMNLEGNLNNSPFLIKVEVFAKFAHGMKVNGELTIKCLINNKEIIEKEIISETKKLISTQLIEGKWLGNIDIKDCGINEKQQKSNLKIIAEVVEKGSFLSNKISKEWDPFTPGFEMIPLRPAYTRNTQNLHVYLFNSINEGNVELKIQCISDDRSVNGLNQSLIQRLGTIAEIKVDSRCISYIIKARRKLFNENFSKIKLLIIPLIIDFNPFDFSLIELNQNKVEYLEGEFIEAKIRDIKEKTLLNYALICGNGKELSSIGNINLNNQINVTITERMGNGACILYVYGINEQNSKMVMDMRLIFTKTGFCSKEKYGLKIPKENLTVGYPINITLNAQPKSLATLHIYDSRLDLLFKNSHSFLLPNTLWTFSEFLNPEPGEHFNGNFIWFSNVLQLQQLFLKRKEVCQLTGKRTPQCPIENNEQITTFGKIKIQNSLSKFSTECLREIQEECERKKIIGESANGFLTHNNNQQNNHWPIKTSGNSNQFMWMLNKKSHVENNIANQKNVEMEDLKAFRSGKVQNSNNKNDDVLLRHFFPEVWMFDDFYIGQTGELKLNLQTPHTVTEWLFIPKFWTNGHRDVCQLSNRETLLIQKNVFMDIDIPSNIYVNETISVKVTVSAENLKENKRLAICFKGLSPFVCGDVGRDGVAGEIDFTRIELSIDKPIQQKRFFVRFLRPGLHNLSFELRNEEILKGHGWHCRDENIQVLDRILKQIKVNKRVDIEEHFRQIVIYQRKGLPSRTVTLEQVLGENLNIESSTKEIITNNNNYLILHSTKDIISYSQQQPLLNNEEEEEQEEGSNDNSIIIDNNKKEKKQLITQIQINPSGLQVFSIQVEFSKFVASFPPEISTELFSASSFSHNSDQFLQRLRNRSPINLISPSIIETTRRRKRSKNKRKKSNKELPKIALIKGGININERGNELINNRPLQGYSLPNLLKELSQTSYEFKSLNILLNGFKINEDLNENILNNNNLLKKEWLEQKEQYLGNLLAELLTFSDCQEGNKICAFGEFGKPKNDEERNLVLTSLATSLLCEQRTPDEYICAPIQFLADKVLNILNNKNEKDFEQIIKGIDSFIKFNDKKSKWLFLQALIVQVVLDCSAYACAASLINEQSSLAKEAWMKLHNSFYKSIDLSVDYDVRIIAAFAYMSTPAIRSEMRAKLASRTINDNQVPYWGINDYSNKKSNKYDLIEKSLQKSSIVLVNSLALLAYTQNQSIYRFWRNEFNLEALSNWLIEQQNSNRQYENALDTFFASRALHQFSVVNAQRQIREALTGTINANFTIYSSTSLHSNISKLFKDKDLPFGIFIRPNVRQMDLKSNGDSQLLLGVKVQIEKRKRSRRDPNDIEPIILNLKQKRIKPGFINQTVTIRCNSQLINSLQIEHGIFTGFNSYSHFVNILKGSAKFQIEPQISANAIYFVLINIKKEVDIIYSITLIEPNGGYLPENLAPISINAMYHHLPLAQLIVLPQDFDFIEQKIIRKERSVSEKIVVLPSSIFPVSTSFLIPLNNTLNEQILTTTITTQHQQFLNLITENNDKPQSDIVETICLQTGACTCAELSCTVKCSSCSRLTFSELCANINSAEGKKFALFFRISSNNIDKVFIGDSSTEYIVLRNVRIMEWKSNEIEHPEHINIWIRSCNLNCLRMINERREGELPRFLLIGDPRGLFDESDAVEIQNNNYGNIKINENSRSTKMLLQTHYLMRDDDRLLKSTDCYELFGKVEDESCV